MKKNDLPIDKFLESNYENLEQFTSEIQDLGEAFVNKISNSSIDNLSEVMSVLDTTVTIFRNVVYMLLGLDNILREVSEEEGEEGNEEPISNSYLQ